MINTLSPPADTDIGLRGATVCSGHKF